MDTITHAAMGIGVYSTWLAFAPPDPHLSHSVMLAAAVLGSEICDLDTVMRLFGRERFLYAHRRATHSLPGTLFFALLIAAVFQLWSSGKGPEIFFMAWFCALLHVLSDVLTAYGTAVFWPISEKRYALDVLFLYEYAWDVWLVLGLVLHLMGIPLLKVVILCDGLALLLLFIRVLNRLILPKRVRPIQQSDESAVFPPALLPWRQQFVFAHPSGIVRFGSCSWFKSPVIDAVYQTEETQAFHYVLHETKLGREFSRLARVLIGWTEREGDGFRVRLADAVFRSGRLLPFHIWVVLRLEGERFAILSEGMRFEAFRPAAWGGQVVDFPLRNKKKTPSAHSIIR
ncbi:metal-dependent hydrolase [Alicyclobacillus tolerans]|uniref:Membrane-bound metal-dependent hydrolase YbcI (DUF457 family) n=1 Tax=Alicyclobacillus tolerans TaxID=90970 RepID=A0ABT9LUP4_9BACL|nr:metal-dependent hydrolase [Alicyclobacillus tengchongensis]MDP9727994.1 membrane-bound metal-dependent hydrolase YbcI (DUF457 family) [Alicyclobacillus tengchongensis]